jgi:16S rRNA (guanine1207-N2)-methyltransferase
VNQHYFAERPATASRPVTARLRLADVDLELRTDSGVFSRGAVDRGTRLLLETVGTPPAGDLLDLGCGFGAISVTLALRRPEARVWAVDVNERALELTQENARIAAADNVVAVSPDDLPPEVRFAAMYSNPPVRIGKQRLHQLLERWLGRLDEPASAHLVIQRHLGSDSLAAWLSGRGWSVRRVRSRGGYRVLEVHASP